MTLTHHVTNGVDESVIRMQGCIDRDAVAALEESYRLAAATNPRAVLLDFTAVDYINSTGIALIVSMLAQARLDGRTVRGRGLNEHYQHVFAITRLTDYIELVHTAEETV